MLISDQLFTIDRNRFTCSGGTAPLDLMLNLIEAKLGSRVSQRVSEQFIVDRVRKDKDRQYIPLRARVGVSHRGLIRVAQLMEENIEKPLSLEKIARTTGLSRRQIERLFKRDLNCVPKRYYLEMRLRRARELLLQTAMPIMDITAACGFQSPPHFSKCYRNQYGYPPSAERKIGETRAASLRRARPRARAPRRRPLPASRISRGRHPRASTRAPPRVPRTCATALGCSIVAKRPPAPVRDRAVVDTGGRRGAGESAGALARWPARPGVFSSVPDTARSSVQRTPSSGPRCTPRRSLMVNRPPRRPTPCPLEFTCSRVTISPAVSTAALAIA